MDVQVCKTRIMQTCPSCRHSYQDQLYSSCPRCSREKLDLSRELHLGMSRATGPSCPVPLYDHSLSKHKEDRQRKFVSGGTLVIQNGDTAGKDNRHRENTTISPTAPLSFVLPPVLAPPPVGSSKALVKIADKLCTTFSNSEEDLRGIMGSQRLLKMSGWYHQGLSWEKAIELLMPTSVGSFLVRDSSDSKYLYSLSVQTKCGPTSVRIHYSNGEFRLDADDNVARYMRKYNCLIELIQRYIESTKKQPLKCSHENESPVWVRCVGKIYSNIVLEKPIYRKGYFPQLKHLSRLRVNRSLVDPNFISVIQAPKNVVAYLQEYPYRH